jgi:hypothetical protein
MPMELEILTRREDTIMLEGTWAYRETTTTIATQEPMDEDNTEEYEDDDYDDELDVYDEDEEEEEYDSVYTPPELLALPKNPDRAYLAEFLKLEEMSTLSISAMSKKTRAMEKMFRKVFDTASVHHDNIMTAYYHAYQVEINLRRKAGTFTHFDSSMVAYTRKRICGVFFADEFFDAPTEPITEEYVFV